LLCGGAYYAAKYYVYRLIVADGGVQVHFSDLRLSLFPLGLEIHDIKNFPIRDENLVSFAGVNAYLPPTSLFMKKKAISIEIDRPRFVLNDSLLRGKARGKGLGSSFTVNRIRIRNGELFFNGRDIQCRLLDFNLQSGNLADGFSFRVDSPHLSVTLPVSGEPVTLEGNVTGEAHQQKESWKISRFAWQTREMLFNANGRILPQGAYQFNVSAQGNPENILLPLLDELTVKGLTYANARIAKDPGGLVRVTADFTAPSCRIKENPCRNLAAKVQWDNRGRTLDLDSAFDTGLARSSLRLVSRGGETRITVRDLPAALVADILDISQDAPLAGVVSRGRLEIDPRFLRGRAELDVAPGRPLSQPFVLKGSFDFLRDKKAKLTTFSGQRLQAGAGEISVSGRADSLARTSTIRIEAALKNLENVAPYSAFYLGIDLLPWKLSGGSGVFELVLDRRQGRKRIDSRFRMLDFQANRQSISALRGDVRHTPPTTRGDFTITAPDLNSRADLAITVGRTTIRFPDVAGEARKIMKLLGLDMDLSGKIAGDFTYSTGKALKEPDVQGSFTAPHLEFMGYALEQVKGSLRSNLQGIELAGLDFAYKGGRARGAGVRIDFAGKQFDINGRIAGIDVSRLQGDFSGHADLEISGRGEFMKDPLTIAYRFQDMSYYRDRGFSAAGRASLLTDFSDFQLSAAGDVTDAAGASPFKLDIGRRQGRYEGSFQFVLNNLDLLIPWKNNVGSMRLLGQIFTAPAGGLGSRGVAIFSGRTLSLPNFSHSLDNFQGTVTFIGTKFSLQSLRGEMGGGPVEGNGQLTIEGNELRRMVFYLQGKGLRLYPMDRTSCLVNPDLTLKYEDKKLLLSGTLAFQAVEWQREIDERIVFSTRSELSTAESKIREMLQLDIALNSENILMQNSLGRIRGRFKLRLTGTASFPILRGTCEGNQGEIYFSDRSFNLVKAKLVFNNNFFIDPLIHVESEAFIQNYRIRFDIRGSASRAKPELTASPPLPPQDILALVSLGEVFKRTPSTEVSSQQGGTALVTGKLTEEIKNRANKLLGINLLRIDPVLSGQSTVDTSRLTIGKTISKDLVVVYSTNLSTSRQEILYLQYQLSPTISLIAMRNEEGRYSLDLRLRSRR
jgi:hypothetical protein